MSTVLGLNCKPEYTKFKTFLSTLEVYGTGYQDEVWANRVEEITHRDRVIKELRLIIRLFDLAVLALQRGQCFSEEFYNKH